MHTYYVPKDMVSLLSGVPAGMEKKLTHNYVYNGTIIIIITGKRSYYTLYSGH